ncbi:Ubiquitin carboxyl-terminal hydrolase 10 [Diatrype stigma]|uniref:Ubiquitin carboxyl-terminal hydrolase 10 n=1 Tax=Diatrype stigma TaxID=117547 RepID=A0AAN9YPM7_9PEZI
MTKRYASEALEELLDIASPASKRSRFDDGSEFNGNGNGTSGSTPDVRPDDDDDDDDMEDEPAKAPIRQTAPTEGYDDLYLDTIDRNVLDFDFEKLCSVSLSNINVYACLVCGKYFQGRGPKSHAYFHALDEDHHVFINMETQRVYVLPEGYEVRSKSLDDIKYVANPRYTRAEVVALDRQPRTAWTLDGRAYTPGFVGMNNIKDNDYLNVVVQALSHVAPLRNFFLLEDLSARPELVRRCAVLFRKIWNPRAFKNHVSPHELLQEISLRSNKRFNLTAQSDPVEFLSWFLNNLHLGLGGSRAKPGSSIVQRIFQGKLKMESQAITVAGRPDADADSAMANSSHANSSANQDDRLRFEEAAEVKTDVHRFLLLTLDLPAAPLFQDELERNIIPQVPLTSLLAKYDGATAQERLAQRVRYRLQHPLPPYLAFHVKRFSANKFVEEERNPTIVTFDARVGLDVAPYVEPGSGGKDDPPAGEPIWYDLVANVVHEAVRAKEDVADSGEERKTWKVQLRDKGRDEWVVCQDLFVEKTQKELLYLGETYLQIWERRRDPNSTTKGAKKRKT